MKFPPLQCIHVTSGELVIHHPGKFKSSSGHVTAYCGTQVQLLSLFELLFPLLLLPTTSSNFSFFFIFVLLFLLNYFALFLYFNAILPAVTRSVYLTVTYPQWADLVKMQSTIQYRGSLDQGTFLRWPTVECRMGSDV